MEYVYKLTHTYNEEPNRFTVVQSNLPKQDFEKLVAFIEFKSADIDDSYGIDQEEIAEVLCELYGASMLPEGDYPEAIELDHYINWERYCGSSEEIENIEEFQRKDLKLMLKTYIEQYYEGMPEE